MAIAFFPGWRRQTRWRLSIHMAPENIALEKMEL